MLTAGIIMALVLGYVLLFKFCADQFSKHWPEDDSQQCVDAITEFKAAFLAEVEPYSTPILDWLSRRLR